MSPTSITGTEAPDADAATAQVNCGSHVAGTSKRRFNMSAKTFLTGMTLWLIVPLSAAAQALSGAPASVDCWICVSNPAMPHGVECVRSGVRSVGLSYVHRGYRRMLLEWAVWPSSRGTRSVLGIPSCDRPSRRLVFLSACIDANGDRYTRERWYHPLPSGVPTGHVSHAMEPIRPRVAICLHTPSTG